MLNLLRGEPLTGPIHVRPPVPASESDVPGALERHLITMGKSPRIYRGVRGGLTALPSNRLLAFKPVALVCPDSTCDCSVSPSCSFDRCPPLLLRCGDALPSTGAHLSLWFLGRQSGWLRR